MATRPLPFKLHLFSPGWVGVEVGLVWVVIIRVKANYVQLVTRLANWTWAWQNWEEEKYFSNALCSSECECFNHLKIFFFPFLFLLFLSSKWLPCVLVLGTNICGTVNTLFKRTSQALYSLEKQWSVVQFEVRTTFASTEEYQHFLLNDKCFKLPSDFLLFNFQSLLVCPRRE